MGASMMARNDPRGGPDKPFLPSARPKQTRSPCRPEAEGTVVLRWRTVGAIMASMPWLDSGPSALAARTRAER